MTDLSSGSSDVRRILDNQLAFVVLTDVGGTVLEINEPAVVVAGLRREDVIGKRFWECPWCLHDAAVQERCRQAVVQAAAGEVVRRDETFRVKGDATLLVDFSVKPVFGALGEVTELVISGVDLSGLQAADEALRESLELNRQIVHSAREGIIVFSRELRYVAWNPFMEQLSGLPADSVLGRHPLEVFPFLKDQGVSEGLEKALAGIPSEESEAILPTGEWVSRTFDPLFDSGEQIVGVIVTVHRITERKHAEQALLKLNSELEDRVRERTRELEETVEQLQKALSEIRTLKGLIPICSWCKRIRDECGSWHELEVYLKDRLPAEFTHGICAACRDEWLKRSAVPET